MHDAEGLLSATAQDHTNCHGLELARPSSMHCSDGHLKNSPARRYAPRRSAFCDLERWARQSLTLRNSLRHPMHTYTSIKTISARRQKPRRGGTQCPPVYEHCVPPPRPGLPLVSLLYINLWICISRNTARNKAQVICVLCFEFVVVFSDGTIF